MKQKLENPFSGIISNATLSTIVKRYRKLDRRRQYVFTNNINRYIAEINDEQIAELHSKRVKALGKKYTKLKGVPNGSKYYCELGNGVRLYIVPFIEYSNSMVNLELTGDRIVHTAIGSVGITKLDNVVKSYISGIKRLNRLAVRMKATLHADVNSYQIRLDRGYFDFKFTARNWQSSVIFTNDKSPLFIHNQHKIYSSMPRIVPQYFRIETFNKTIYGKSEEEKYQGVFRVVTHDESAHDNRRTYGYIITHNDELKYLLWNASNVLIIDLNNLPNIEKKIKSHINSG